MHDIAVLKTPHYMDDGIHFPDIRKKLIAKSFALRSSLNQSCDIYEFDRRRYDLLRLIHPAKHVKPLIWYGYDSHIGIDRTERVIRRFCAGLRQ